MKRPNHYKYINIVLLLIVLVIMCFSCSHHKEVLPKDCEELKAQGIVDSFPYPIRPGSPEWENLSNQEEKYQAVNIPDNILQNMCTHGLVYTCVYCPLFWNLTAANDIRTGFLSLSDNINSFTELINRYDAGIELFEYYKTLLDTTLHNISLASLQIQIYHTEIFFAQQEFLVKLNTNELQDVLQEAYNKLFEKVNHNLYNECIKGSYYLMSNILYYNLAYEPLIEFIDRNDLFFFLNNFWSINEETSDSLKYYAELYIQEVMN